MPTLPPPRESSGWVGVNTFFEQLQLTAATKQDELWLILQSFSESKKRGLELAAKYDIPEPKREEAWQRFSSFIYQAKNFWQAAQKTDNNSSPLLYYYCFLNLVKAYLVLNKFRVKNRMEHGLQFSVENIPDFLQQELSIPNQRGKTLVFPLYYKTIYKRRKPPQKLNLIKVLSYVPEIGSQYVTGGYGRPSTVPCLHIIELKADIAKHWSVFAIGNEFPIPEINRTNPLFARGFEQIDITRSLFGQLDIERKFKKDYLQLQQGFHLFQSKDSKMMNMLGDSILPHQNAHEVQKALNPNLGVNFNNDGWAALLYRPYAPSTPFNQELAVYVVMYYLSTLVRYRPDYLRNILEGEHKWLLDSFIVSSPTQFLHSITCRIVKENYRFGSL